MELIWSDLKMTNRIAYKLPCKEFQVKFRSYNHTYILWAEISFFPKLIDLY